MIAIRLFSWLECDHISYCITKKLQIKTNLMVFAFLQRKCHPLTRCIKKIADQPCLSNFLFEKGRTQILKKGMPLIKKCCQLVNFSSTFL